MFMIYNVSQERLNEYAMIAIGNDILESTDTKDLIENFAFQNASCPVYFKYIN